MNDSRDNASGPTPLSDAKKEALRLKLNSLKKLPRPSVPIAQPVHVETLEELSASDLIEEDDGAPRAEHQFELADLGAAPKPRKMSTLDPANLELVAEEDFEDEATQLGEAYSFEEDMKLPNGLEEVSSEFDSPKSSKPNLKGTVEENASSSMKLVRSTASGFQSQAPLPTPIQVPSSVPLPSPILKSTPAPADGDDEDEFQSQKTELLNSPFESDGLVAKLRVMEGPDLGKEFLLTTARNTIGRGDMNSVMVADAAMSRQHIEVIRNSDDSYTVRDLQSVNGTTLNGTRIRESDLFHGDRIEAGKTTLQFMLQGDLSPPSRNRKLVPAALSTQAGQTALHDLGVRPPQAAPNNNRMMLYVGGIAVLLLLVLALAAAFVLTNKPQGPSANQAQEASKLYLKGVDNIKLREWTQAKAKFAKAKELDPKLAVQAQLDRIDNEMAALKALNEAKDFHADGKLEDAAARVAAVPKESVYYDESRILVRKKKSVEVNALYRQAQERVTDDDFDGARALIAKIRESTPNHQGARDLEEKMKRIGLEQETQRLEKDVAIARKEQKELEALAPRPNRPKSSRSKRVINFTKGYSLYRDKKFDAAIKFFKGVQKKSRGTGSKRAARTATDIADFKSSYKQAKRAYATKNWSTAEKLLFKARRTDSSISGGKGYFGPELSGLLASVKGNLGLEALKRKDYSKAAKLQKEGARYASSDDAVRKLKKSLQSEARNLYVKAANARKTDARKSAKLCRQIMAMVPNSDPSHKKAKKLLKEL